MGGIGPAAAWAPSAAGTARSDSDGRRGRHGATVEVMGRCARAPVQGRLGPSRSALVTIGHKGACRRRQAWKALSRTSMQRSLVGYTSEMPLIRWDAKYPLGAIAGLEEHSHPRHAGGGFISSGGRAGIAAHMDSHGGWQCGTATAADQREHDRSRAVRRLGADERRGGTARGGTAGRAAREAPP